MYFLQDSYEPYIPWNDSVVTLVKNVGTCKLVVDRLRVRRRNPGFGTLAKTWVTGTINTRSEFSQGQVNQYCPVGTIFNLYPGTEDQMVFGSRKRTDGSRRRFVNVTLRSKYFQFLEQSLEHVKFEDWQAGTQEEELKIEAMGFIRKSSRLIGSVSKIEIVPKRGSPYTSVITL